MTSWFDIVRERPIEWQGSRYEEYPLFNRISIETTSYCNRDCSFCPVSKGRRPKQISMRDELFESIAVQLEDLTFEGVVQLFLLNEPTLDKQLLKRAERLYKIPGKISIYVSTNCDLLLAMPVDKAIAKLYEYWCAGINVINLNVYDAGTEQLTKIHALRSAAIAEYPDTIRAIEKHKYNAHTQGRLHLAITDMRPDRVASDVSLVNMLHERTQEDKPGGSTVTAPQIHCARPHRHMVVRYDGLVPLCCAVDPTASDLVIAGDLNKTRMLDVWNSETFTKYRWRLQQAKRDLPMCSQCTHRMAYSHVVRRVAVPETYTMKWLDEVHAGETAEQA